MQFFDNNCLSHHNCVSRTPVLRKKKTTVLHMTAVFHITVSWFQICLKQDMQNIFGSHMPKKNFPSHITRPPFKLATSGDVQNKTKPKQFHLPRTFLQENHATCRSKTKKNVCLVLVVPCDMQKKRTCSGVLSSSTNCSQNGFCQFFVIHTGCCPVDIVHPCMFLTLAPTKMPCEQIAKTS